MPTTEHRVSSPAMRTLSALIALPILWTAAPGAAFGQFPDQNQFKPEPLEIAAAYPAPRPAGSTFNFSVRSIAGGGLRIKLLPNPWRNSLVRIYMPLGDASPEVAKQAPDLVNVISYMRGPLLEEVRTANDGSLDHVMRDLPLSGIYQVDILTAGPSTATPGPGQISVQPVNDLVQTVEPRKTYSVVTTFPGQQAILSFSGTRGSAPMLKTWGTGMPVAMYLYAPDGSMVWRHARGDGPANDMERQNPGAYFLNNLPADGTYQWVLVFDPNGLGNVYAALD